METQVKEKKPRVQKVKPETPITTALTKRDFGIIAQNFDKEPKEVQDSLIAISSQLQLIKLNLSEPPMIVSYLIRKAYSDMTDTGIHVMLWDGLKNQTSTILAGEDAADVISNLTKATIDMPDTQWNCFWDGMFKAIAAPLLSWEKLMSYAPYVYGVLVKPFVK